MNVLPNTATLSIPARTGDMRRAAGWLQTAGEARGVPMEDIGRLDMCLHEALANVIDHGGLPAGAEVQLLLETQEDSATLTVVDSGQPFDLTQAAAPERPKTLEATMPGGLGVVMIRMNSDQLNYAYRDGCNRLAITVRWSAA